MKRINISTTCSRDEVMSMLSDAPRVNQGLTFDDREGSPTLRIKEGTGQRVRLRCIMVGGASRDDGYLQGTFFWGRLRQSADGCTLRGMIMTEPVFHALWAALIAFFIITCIQRAALSVIPICFIVFVYLMFRKEYRKQEYLRRYLLRAIHRLEKQKQ